MRILYLWLVLLIIAGCAESENNEISGQQEIAETSMLEMGDSIASAAQKILVQQVMAAIQKGGPAYAVEFCNTHAIPLTDSISRITNVTIQRISEKNRNPDNGILTSTDSLAMQTVRFSLENNQEPVHAVYNEANSTDVIYYKPIKIGMPTCLSCHGDAEKDISAEALRIINAKYPADKATDYKEGDFRGLWKITFSDMKIK